MTRIELLPCNFETKYTGWPIVTLVDFPEKLINITNKIEALSKSF